MVAPTQTVVGPEIGATTGKGLTVTVLEVLAVPQGVVIVQMMSTTPADTPVAIPVPAPIVAIAGLLVLQTKPGVAVGLVYVAVTPTHKVEGPTMVPGEGEAITVILIIPSPLL